MANPTHKLTHMYGAMVSLQVLLWATRAPWWASKRHCEPPGRHGEPSWWLGEPPQHHGEPPWWLAEPPRRHAEPPWRHAELLLYYDDANILFAAALEAELLYLYWYLRPQYIKFPHIQVLLQVPSLYLQRAWGKIIVPVLLSKTTVHNNSASSSAITNWHLTMKGKSADFLSHQKRRLKKRNYYVPLS